MLEEFSDAECEGCAFAACALVCGLQALVRGWRNDGGCQAMRNSFARAARYSRHEANAYHRLSCALRGAPSVTWTK